LYNLDLYIDLISKEIKNEFEVRAGYDDRYMTKEKIIEWIQDADAIVSFGEDHLKKDILEHAKNLKVISSFGAGYNTIDVDYATQRGKEILLEIIVEIPLEIIVEILLEINVSSVVHAVRGLQKTH
jgi:lactate dehydrogenase-like 2-hydroxyacid dehydrogenase